LKKKIIFVCTGNTCRSPLAQVFTKSVLKELNEEWEVESAGVAVFAEKAASESARLVAAEYGLDLSGHISRQLMISHLHEADLVLAMTGNHVRAINQRYPDFKQKICALKEFLGDSGDVTDPFGGDLNIYRASSRELRDLTVRLVEKLKNFDI